MFLLSGYNQHFILRILNYEHTDNNGGLLRPRMRNKIHNFVNNVDSQVSVVTTSFQFHLVGSGHLFMLVWLFLLNRQSFQHNLFKVLMLTTSLCLWAERERMSLLLKWILKYSFTRHFVEAVVWAAWCRLERSTLILKCRLYLRLFLEVHNGNKKISSCLLSLTLFRIEEPPQLMDKGHN